MIFLFPASNYDVLYNPLQHPRAGASSEIDVNNLYGVSVAKESVATQLALLCVAQTKLKPRALGIAALTDLSGAATFGTNGGISLVPSE